MRIILANPNTLTTPKPPLGLLSIGTVLKREGHDVAILDANLLDLQIADVVIRCKDDNADLVGVTAMTPSIGWAIAFTEALKQSMPVATMIGGVHASIFPDELAGLGIFDVVVTGEGEVAALHIPREMERSKLKPVYNGNTATWLIPPPPDYTLIDVLAYEPRYPHGMRTPWTSMTTSRGCPYQCTFCSKAVFGSKYRAMNPSQVLDGLLTLRDNHGIRDVTFYDDEFTLDKKRVYRICDLILSSGLDLTWTCESRVDLVNADLLKHMYKAGCRQIFYGVESGNQAVLDKLKKGITLEQVEAVVSMTREAGIRSIGYFMLGCPGETVDTMAKTIEFSKQLKLEHAQFSACSPLPGSRLYDEYGSDNDWASYQYLSGAKKRLIVSDWLTAEDIEKAVEEGNAIYNHEKTD